MAELNNFERLVAKLRDRAAEARKDEGSVVVGYTASYAIYVHENRQMKWRGFPRDRSVRKDKRGVARTGYEGIKGAHGLFWGPTGRAGFLLDVSREMSSQLRAEVTAGMRAGIGMLKSLLRAGLLLQRESQRNVPVDTGNLRASAFTRVEPK